MNRSGWYRWRALGSDGHVLWLKYGFGPGSANALAIRLPDGGCALISPPCDAPPEIYDRISELGGARILIAPNSFHNMGQAAWRTRFPDAISYAPAGALKRLAEQTPGVAYQPIAALEALSPPFKIFLPDGMKAPDLMVQIPTAEGCVWWLGDQFSNNGADDQIWPLRALSGLVGSGLGFRCNAKPEVVYVRDRVAWLGSIRAALVDTPPAVVVPAHGDPVTRDALRLALSAADAVDTRTVRTVSPFTAGAFLFVGLVLALAGVGRRDPARTSVRASS